MAGSFPKTLSLKGKKVVELRYGENPHQKAAFYVTDPKSTLANLKLHAGRGTSLINLTDINAGLEVIKIFNEPAAVVIKHNNPCGIALGKTIEEALERAIDADAESAFGGIIVLNKKVNSKIAEIIVSFKEGKKGNIDIIAAPEIDKEAMELLMKTRKTIGIFNLFAVFATRPSFTESPC